MEEIWKDIEGYEGRYQVSNLGRVKSLKRFCSGKWNGNELINERLLTPDLRSGYKTVYLYGAKNRKFLIHRLVAQAFIPNPDNKPCVDHINTITTDNSVQNLRWVTEKENANNPITLINNKKACSKRVSHFAGLNGCLNYHARPVLRIAPSGEIIEYGSIADAAKEGFSSSNISECCSGKTLLYRGFDWRYRNNDQKPKFDIAEAIKTYGKYKSTPPRPRKRIYRTKDGVRKVYKSIKDAVNDGFDRRCIVKCLNGLRMTHKGYTWSFLP